jgi:hypothetical protein
MWAFGGMGVCLGWPLGASLRQFDLRGESRRLENHWRGAVAATNREPGESNTWCKDRGPLGLRKVGLGEK